MIRKIHFTFIFILCSSFALIIAQSKTLDSKNLFDIKSVSETAISPDGETIAFTLNVPRPLTDKPGSDYRHLYVYKNGKSQAIIEDQNAVYSIAWGNDSRTIYFRAKLGDEKKTQVYKVSADGGSPDKITSHVESISQFEISPDGKRLAFVSTEEETSRKKQLTEKGFDAEIYEEEWLDINLYIQNLNEEKAKKLTSNFSVFDFHWSPDNSKIIAAVAERNLVDDSYVFKTLYRINPDNGQASEIVKNPGKLSDFAVSPDGKLLAFVAGIDINDPVSGSLFIAETENSKKFEELKNYSKDFIGSVEDVAWKDNSTVLFSAEEGVDKTLSSIEVGDDDRDLLLEAGEIVFSGFSYENGRISLAGNTPSHPSELFLYTSESDELKKLTNFSAWLMNYKLAKQEKISYKAEDGLEIEAVLTYPLNFEEGKKYPMIIYIHGGPEASVSNGWTTSYSMWGQIAAAKDFFVFMPNYRASSGRGVEYSKMDFGDIGGQEFIDVIDGIKYLSDDKGWVDKNKVGIGGGSYGGFFAAWGATKHTEHFAASVMFVGISNQISKRFTTDIPFEMYNVHWGVWPHESWELHLDRSPVKYATQSKTPTLILHGKEDPRVHPSQSLELYRALKVHGKAPVRLVWYPGQGHGNSKNTSKYDYNVRTMDWFEYYLKSDKPKDKMPDKYISID